MLKPIITHCSSGSKWNGLIIETAFCGGPFGTSLPEKLR